MFIKDLGAAAGAGYTQSNSNKMGHGNRAQPKKENCKVY